MLPLLPQLALTVILSSTRGRIEKLRNTIVFVINSRGVTSYGNWMTCSKPINRANTGPLVGLSLYFLPLCRLRIQNRWVVWLESVYAGTSCAEYDCIFSLKYNLRVFKNVVMYTFTECLISHTSNIVEQTIIRKRPHYRG